MAFDRFKTKLAQAVTSAEKTETPPELKEGLKQFEETKTLGNNMRDAIKEALPVISSKCTKMENLGTLMKQIAAKYGLDKPEAQEIQAAGDIILAIGKEERALLAKVEQTYALIKNTHDYFDALKKERSKMETAATDMDGANLDTKKSGKDPGRAQSATRAYQNQKEAVEAMVATLPQHRDKQREAAKNFLQSQREFYLRCAEIIESRFEALG